jgi:hypothetical protein
MAMRQLRRVAGIDDIDKLNTFDYTSAAYIETRNNSFRQHLSQPRWYRRRNGDLSTLADNPRQGIFILDHGSMLHEPLHQ